MQNILLLLPLPTLTDSLRCSGRRARFLQHNKFGLDARRLCIGVGLGPLRSNMFRDRHRAFGPPHCELLGVFDEVAFQNAKHPRLDIDRRAELNVLCETGLKTSVSDEFQKGRTAIQSLHTVSGQQIEVSPR